MSRRHHVIVTSTGVVIGGAYLPPMRKLGRDEERIQQVLLTRSRSSSRSCALLTYIATALAAVLSAISTVRN